MIFVSGDWARLLSFGYRQGREVATRCCGESADKIVWLRTVIVICLVLITYDPFLAEAGRAGAVYNLYFVRQILLLYLFMFAHRRQLDIHGRQSFNKEQLKQQQQLSRICTTDCMCWFTELLSLCPFG